MLGALRRDDRVVAPERHLGLVPAAEREQRTRAALAALADAVERYVDLDGLLALARTAPALARRGVERRAADGAGDRRPRIAIARGPAFSFHYEENLELLRGGRRRAAPFDPLSDEALPPDAGALVLAGGFPEVFGAELAANAPLRAEVAASPAPAARCSPSAAGCSTCAATSTATRCAARSPRARA